MNIKRKNNTDFTEIFEDFEFFYPKFKNKFTEVCQILNDNGFPINHKLYKKNVHDPRFIMGYGDLDKIKRLEKNEEKGRKLTRKKVSKLLKKYNDLRSSNDNNCRLVVQKSKFSVRIIVDKSDDQKNNAKNLSKYRKTFINFTKWIYNKYIKGKENMVKKYNKLGKELKLVLDGTGFPIDKHIFESVRVLNTIGIQTSQSCHGHIERGNSYPWIEIKFKEWDESWEYELLCMNRNVSLYHNILKIMTSFAEYKSKLKNYLENIDYQYIIHKPYYIENEITYNAHNIFEITNMGFNMIERNDQGCPDRNKNNYREFDIFYKFITKHFS